MRPLTLVTVKSTIKNYKCKQKLLNKCYKFTNQCYIKNFVNNFSTGNKILTYENLHKNLTYEDIYNHSIENPSEFWHEIAQKIEWFKPYEQVIDNSNPPFTKWFSGGLLNTSYNALDRHVKNGRGNRVALIHDSPITSRVEKVTYAELLKKVSYLAGALTSIGVRKGDAVVIYMSMIPETVVAMLATARIGAIHNLVFGGFAAHELSVRINHSKPKVVLTSSVGLEPSRIIPYKSIVDNAIEMSVHKPKYSIVFQRVGFDRVKLNPDRDFDWNELIDKNISHDAVPVESNHPAYLLYTSGTSGAPKAIVRPTGGHAVVLPWTMNFVYGISPEDIWWAASDFGWVVGHSYICYGPLLNGSTSIIYEGKPVGTPDSKQFFRVINEHGVKSMFVAPTAVRAIAREYNSAKNETKSNFKNLFVAGEVCDNKTRIWAEKAFGVPVLDHWWQTETGFPISVHCTGLESGSDIPRNNTGKPLIGFNVKVLSENGNEALPHGLGRIACKLPLPPGTFSSLYQDDARFKDLYFSKFEGYYDTMDTGFICSNGFVNIRGRDDDVINVAGHRLSTQALEDVILSHSDIAEAVVIGVNDELKGEVPVCLYVAKNINKPAIDLTEEIVKLVRDKIGPVASFRTCIEVPGLPKTRSGKTPRKSFSDLAKGNKIKIPPTIEDPSLYEDITNALINHGYQCDTSFLNMVDK